MFSCTTFWFCVQISNVALELLLLHSDQHFDSNPVINQSGHYMVSFCMVTALGALVNQKPFPLFNLFSSCVFCQCFKFVVNSLLIFKKKKERIFQFVSFWSEDRKGSWGFCTIVWSVKSSVQVILTVMDVLAVVDIELVIFRLFFGLFICLVILTKNWMFSKDFEDSLNVSTDIIILLSYLSCMYNILM